MKNKKQAFTLIELMIVIAIIGVLAVTIIPQLTGAQARARDTGRIASLKNVTAVLETYFGDNGIFPDEETGGCLSNTDGSLKDDKLKDLFQQSKAPTDPQKGSIAKPCNKQSSYGYKKLTKASIDGGAYVLTAHVETMAKANTNGAVIDWEKEDWSEYDNVGLYESGSINKGEDQLFGIRY